MELSKQQSTFVAPAGQGPDSNASHFRAHPPIHPTRYTPGEQGWAHDKKALYEFVVRSFLA